MIHIYCGDGKGKTTAAMGLALRCAGNGGRVKIVQFLKDNSSSERKILENIPGIDLVQGREIEKFVFNMSGDEKKEASVYYSQMLDEVFANTAGYDMLILDEVIAAVECGMIDEECLIDCISNINAEIVMTGRNPSYKLKALADYVTEMKKIKHPFDKGICARKGVEF